MADHNKDNDEDRYASATGWDGSDTKESRERRKQIDKYRRDNARDLFDGTALAVEDANEVFDNADGEVPPRALFGDLFREGELAILFADTGIGKSILATQIGEAIARGKNAIDNGELKIENARNGQKRDSDGACSISDLKFQIPNSDPHSAIRTPHSALRSLRNEAEPLPVLYVDFELTRAQFAERYSTGVREGRYYGRHRFPSKKWFARVTPDWEGPLPEGYKTITQLLGDSVADLPFTHPNTRVLIIDNLTYLAASTSNATGAARLMKALESLKKEAGLSILVLAHTPKRAFRDTLTVNDLQGSKMLSNFADTIFCIGRDHSDRDVRFIKQIKSRGAALTHGTDNVITCRLVKQRGFLKFAFERLSDEYEHLTRPAAEISDARESLITEARRLSATGVSQRAIARRLGLGKTTIVRYLSDEVPSSRSDASL